MKKINNDGLRSDDIENFSVIQINKKKRASK